MIVVRGGMEMLVWDVLTLRKKVEKSVRTVSADQVIPLDANDDF